MFLIHEVHIVRSSGQLSPSNRRLSDGISSEDGRREYAEVIFCDKEWGLGESFICSYSYTIRVRLTERNRKFLP